MRSVLLVLMAFACARPTLAQQAPAPSPADEALEGRIEAALARADDLPADSLDVQVAAGVVTITGSVLCDGCGGNSTPGGAATVQQSLGAVVRAVPGVERVEFRLRYEPASGGD